MRIAFLTPEYVRPGFPDGGIANYLANFASILVEKGHEANVFLVGYNSRTFVQDRIRIKEVREPRLGFLQSIPRLRAFRGLLEQIICAQRLAAAFLTEHHRRPFDIIQVPSYRGLGNGVVGRVDIPVVLFVSGFGPIFRASQERLTYFPDHLADWLEIRQIRRADAAFVPSRFLARCLKQYLGLDIPVYRTPFHPRAEPEDPSLWKKELGTIPYILYFGKLAPCKGIDELIEATPQVFERCPDVYLTIVGFDCGHPKRGPYLDMIRRQIDSKWKSRLVLLDLQPRSKLLPIVRNARVVVLPSRVDNYPNTFVEARAMGKIVVAPRDSSIDESIVDGETGFLCDQGSASSLAKAIMRALALPPEDVIRMENHIREVARKENEDAICRLIKFHEDQIRMFQGRKAI